MNAANSLNSSQGFLMRPTFGSQVVLAIIILFILFVSMLAVETFYKAYFQMSSAKLALYPYTVGSNKQIVIPQNPRDPKAKTAWPSENEATGIEFSYSSFIYIHESTFNGNASQNTMKSIFHKGYKSPFPLCGPGVFVHSASNSLRILMNSYEKWYNFVDIPDIPIEKWFHLVIVCRNNALEIYINGNLIRKLTFNGTLPYQNYQDIVLFSSAQGDDTSVTGGHKTVPSGDDFIPAGPMNGYISNLYYFRYAVSFTEIQDMMNMGPSRQFADSDMDKPPYLIDSWWTTARS